MRYRSACLYLALLVRALGASADLSPPPPQTLTPSVPAAIAAPQALEIFAVLDRTHPQFVAAETLSQQLRNGAQFNAALHAQLGRPTAAEPYFVFSRLPAHFEVHETSSRYQGETMLRLRFPGATPSASVLEVLRASRRFKSVSVIRDAPPDFNSARPPNHFWMPEIIINDPLYEAPATAQRPAGNYPWLRMNFEGAWELNKGRALIGALDAGVFAEVAVAEPHAEIIHEDLGEKFASHLSQNTSVVLNFNTAQQYVVHITEELGPVENGTSGQNPRGHGTHVAAIMAADVGNGRGSVGACPLCPLVMARFRIDDVTLPTSSRVFRAFTRDSMLSMIDNGVTVLNRSGARPWNVAVDCSLQSDNIQELCVPFRRAYNRDVLLVSSAGNDRADRLPFPNNISFNPNVQAFDPAFMAVGGHQALPSVPLTWISPLNCTFQEGCGSNYGEAKDVNQNVTNRLSVLAAAPNVLSAFYRNGVWSAPSCQDTVADHGVDYDYCTGTSMSAPLVSGLAGLLRSANPLLTRLELRSIIEQTASRRQASLPWFSAEGFGIPDATLATQVVLGRWLENAQIKQWKNRLTPLFHLSNPAAGFASVNCSTIEMPAPPDIVRSRAASPGTGANLQTSSNQVASSAQENALFIGAWERFHPCLPPPSWAFTSVGSPIPAVGEFQFADTDGLTTNQPEGIALRASLYVFTTGQPVGFYPPGPWLATSQPGPAVTMLPLIRMSFDSPWPAEVANNQTADVCPGRGRDFAYANSNLMFEAFRDLDLCNYAPVPNATPEIAKAANKQSYRLDQVEGFLLASCPKNWQCTGLAGEGGLQKVFLRGRPGNQGQNGLPNEPGQDWVVLLEEQLSQSPWNSYTVKPPINPDDPLGYAFKNMNSDGDMLIDGVEFMIGTDPLNSDTDGDGLLDSDEYHPTRGTLCLPAPGSTAAPTYFGSNPRIPGGCGTMFRNGFEG